MLPKFHFNVGMVPILSRYYEPCVNFSSNFCYSAFLLLRQVLKTRAMAQHSCLVGGHDLGFLATCFPAAGL